MTVSVVRGGQISKLAFTKNRVIFQLTCLRRDNVLEVESLRGRNDIAVKPDKNLSALVEIDAITNGSTKSLFVRRVVVEAADLNNFIQRSNR